MQAIKGILLLTISLLCFSCQKDDPIVIPNEDELITTVKLTLTPVEGGEKIVFLFTDLDGDGAKPPVVINGKLKANTAYTTSINLLNELAKPAVDITEEIQTEKEAHQFFYISAPDLKLTTTYNDVDANNKPVGLLTKMQTEGASNGKLKISLIHEPNKSAEGVANGNPSKAGGETDIEVQFDVTIE